MSLQVYTLKDIDKWDSIIKKFNNYDVYYLRGYTIAFYLHNDGEPLLFYYKGNGIKAINVVMKRDIANDVHFSFLEKKKYFDFATPYGYGGWLIDGEGELTGLFEEYKSWCIKNNIVSEVIRFHPILANQESVRHFYDVMDLGKTVSIDLNNEDDIWNTFTSKNRNIIRKAIKNNIVIKHGLNQQILNNFIEIYNQTMVRDNADKYYYFNNSFYDSINKDLSDNCDVFYAEYNNKVISSAIILKANNKLSYHLSGSLKEYGSLGANNYLLSEVSNWGCKNGYKSFHLGGGVGSKEDKLYAFKKAFNKNDGKQYSIGKMIFNEDVYNKLVELRKASELRDMYFPLYRA